QAAISSALDRQRALLVRQHCLDSLPPRGREGPSRYGPSGACFIALASIRYCAVRWALIGDLTRGFVLRRLFRSACKESALPPEDAGRALVLRVVLRSHLARLALHLLGSSRDS